MKNLKSFLSIILMCVLTFNVSVAQNYKSQFNVKADGVIENANGVKLGWIEPDGTVKNGKGTVVGTISKKDGQAQLLDKLGKKMGTVSEDGRFKDAKGKLIYTISTADENGICKILDASGKEIGTVHENYKQQGACAIHCLK